MKQKTLLLFTAILTLLVMGMLIFVWLVNQTPSDIAQHMLISNIYVL